MSEASATAIAALVDEYAGTLYRVAYSVLRNAADAEDAVQETYLRVLRHRDGLTEIRDPRVWLVRIVWNVVLDRKRRAKTRPETDDIADLARLVQRVTGFSGSLVFDTTKPDGTPRKLLDVSRLTGLGWRASIGLEEGLRSTYEWYLSRQSVAAS